MTTENAGPVTLGDLDTRHVWFTSVGQPAGCDLIAEEGEALALPGDHGDNMASDWWDLSGTVEGNKWKWDGRGEPLDFRANTVLSIVAFVPKAR